MRCILRQSERLQTARTGEDATLSESDVRFFLSVKNGKRVRSADAVNVWVLKFALALSSQSNLETGCKS